jgi:hypothetical protein
LRRRPGQNDVNGRNSTEQCRPNHGSAFQKITDPNEELTNLPSKRQKQSTVPDTFNLHQIEAWASLVGNENRRDGRDLPGRRRLRGVLKEGKATMRMDFDTDVIEMAAELFGAAYAQDPRTEEEFARPWNAAVADILRTHPHTRIETTAYAAGVAMGRFHARAGCDCCKKRPGSPARLQ